MLPLLKQVQERIITQLLAPLVLRTGELDSAIEELKRAVVRLARERCVAPKEVLANHFGRSDRWFYRYLSELEMSRAAKPPHALQELQLVMAALLDIYPRAATAEALLERLSEKRPLLSVTELAGLLDMYVKLGLIETRDPTGPSPSYALAERVGEYSDDGSEALRLDRIGRTSEAIATVSIAYASGAPGSRFGCVSVNVSPEEWAGCVVDLEKLIRRRVHLALDRTLDADPEDRSSRPYKIIFLAGDDTSE